MARSPRERRTHLVEDEDLVLFQLVQENLRFLVELRTRARSAGRGGPLGQNVSCPADVYDLVRYEMGELLQEQARVVLLDTRGNVLDVILVYQGNVNATSFRAAELLRDAVIRNAPSMVLVHNHPSGDPEPSTPDIRLTKELVAAGDLLGIEVSDHVIVGRDSFVSLKQRGLLG